MTEANEEQLDRQKMMEEMLKDHYDEKSEKDRKRKRENAKKYMDSLENPPEKDEFHFPNMQGSHCSLQGSYYQQEPYYVAEVFHPKKPPKGVPKSTCHFFMPESFVKQFPRMQAWKDMRVPFKNPAENVFDCDFPSTDGVAGDKVQVKWAIDYYTARECVDKKEIFILAKSRFKLIQNMQGGPRRVDSKFCLFHGETKLSKIYNDNKPEPIDDYFIPKIELKVFECPFDECKFVSDRKFTGIRSHLLHHFSDQIKKGAKPRAQLSDREKIACMSKTSCSIDNLEERGELVHHYGIFHCLVDDYFQEHVMEWFGKKYKHFFERNLCPYDDIQCENEDGLLDHLVLNHFYNLILAEVENMVMFKLTYAEKHDKQFNVYKCPFCKLRFSNDETDKDLKDLVIHCGTQHGFGVFYLMADKHIEDTRRMVIQGMMVKAEAGEEVGEEKRAKLEPEVVLNVKEENEMWGIKEEVDFESD
jgi:hypothetical protein